MRYKLDSIKAFLVLALATIPFSNVSAADGGNLGTHLVDPIMTDAGYVSGTVMDIQTLAIDGMPLEKVTVGTVGQKVRVYRGIPYAAPPVGNLRWKPPQPVTPWVGIRESTVLTKWPTQQFPTVNRYGPVTADGMSEDSLYLNVVTPAEKATDRLPVLVWFHGGGLTSQSGSRPAYNTPPLAQHGVVLVAVSGRLGVMGFMAHPGLTQEQGGHSGNYGMLDLIAALKWVNTNIAAFGGDPTRITIFGQSGGGMKVNWLMGSPLSNGLFHAAIDMSGIQGGSSLATSEQRGKNLAAYMGITGSTDAEVIAKMRALSWQDVVSASLNSASGFRTDTTIDGWSQTDTLFNVFKNGQQHDVPLLIGMVEKDIKSIYQDTVAILPAIRPLRSKIYAYEFTYVTKTWRDEGAKAWHSIENGYVFGQPALMAPGNYESYGIPAGATTPIPVWNSVDTWMTEYMVKTWIQFAATGDPTLPKGALPGPVPPAWPAYVSPMLDASNRADQYMKIDYPPAVKSGFSEIVE